MVFAKILPEEFVDMAGQKDVDRRVQQLLGCTDILGKICFFPSSLLK
jgi:hypothetical protein